MVKRFARASRAKPSTRSCSVMRPPRFPAPDPLARTPRGPGPVAVFPLRPAEHALDDKLRRDAGVVGAGQPQRVIARPSASGSRASCTRVVHRVAHARAGDVGRRDDDGQTGLGRGRVGVEIAPLFPVLILLALDPCGRRPGLFGSFIARVPSEFWRGRSRLTTSTRRSFG